MTAPARPRPSGREAAALVAAAPFIGLGFAWGVGRLAGDAAWPWQLLFWIPAPAALVACATAWAVLRWLGRSRTRRARIGRGAVAALAAWALVVVAREDVGWGGWGAARRVDLAVTHWNARWPGPEAGARGRAVLPVLGDVLVISNPGAMLAPAVAQRWVPAGATAIERGTFAVVSRIPVTSFRVLAAEQVPGVGLVCAAWITVAPAAGSDDVGILAIDLPSEPRAPRARVADALAAILARFPEAAHPDLVVGDSNCTPGSVVFARCFPDAAPCEPWRASGWLCTYPRERPFWRIDAMLAHRARLRWVGYRTVDLGTGAHRAQQGAFERTGP